MLNGAYCGNCMHWTNTRPTGKGKLPYFGVCSMGRPLKQGKTYKRKGFTFSYCSFKVRSDIGCKEWRKATNET